MLPFYDIFINLFQDFGFRHAFGKMLIQDLKSAEATISATNCCALCKNRCERFLNPGLL